MNKHLIFVYGTLKRGYGNNRLLEQSRFVDAATTENRYPLVVSGIPYLHDVPNVGHHVTGEIWEVTDDQLRRVDQLEGHGRGFYERRKINVISETTREKVETWVYFICTRTRGYEAETLHPSYEDGLQDNRRRWEECDRQNPASDEDE